MHLFCTIYANPLWYLECFLKLSRCNDKYEYLVSILLVVLKQTNHWQSHCWSLSWLQPGAYAFDSIVCSTCYQHYFAMSWRFSYTNTPLSAVGTRHFTLLFNTSLKSTANVTQLTLWSRLELGSISLHCTQCPLVRWRHHSLCVVSWLPVSGNPSSTDHDSKFCKDLPLSQTQSLRWHLACWELENV